MEGKEINKLTYEIEVKAQLTDAEYKGLANVLKKYNVESIILEEDKQIYKFVISVSHKA
ncbi:hypothetical protein [Candidatus Mancarchaeum acidiphilum]|nr:hypothetical protein [Candidatus Mancarchaeum acidiphilum]